jgi:hypothetical protein
MSNITPAISDIPLIKIIVADYDVQVGTLLKLILERASYQCQFAENHEEILSFLKNDLIDILLIEGKLLDNWYNYHRENFLEGEQYLYDVGVIVYVPWSGGTRSSTFIDVMIPKPMVIDDLLHKILRDVLGKYGKLPPN